MAEVQFAPVFDVILLRAGEHTPALVKAIRRHVDLGLPEVARMIARAPTVILRGVPRKQADAAVLDLLAAGARAKVCKRRSGRQRRAG